jgi:hypothetical protein
MLTVPRSSFLVDVGLTKRGIEDIGDINTITSAQTIKKNKEIKVGETVMEIEWDGHARSEADELYHAVWETFTRVTKIISPLNGIVQNVKSIKFPSIHNSIDDNTALYTIETDNDSLMSAVNDFVSKDAYRCFVQKHPRGMFHDQNEHL